MSSSPFNNGEENTRVVQEDLRRDDAEEVAMEEEEENPFGGSLSGLRERHTSRHLYSPQSSSRHGIFKQSSEPRSAGRTPSEEAFTQVTS